MHDLVLIAAKLVVIAAIIIVAVFMAVNVWRADLDLRQLFSPRRIVDRSVDERPSWLPSRERDAIYQNEQIVARVAGVSVDEANATIEFEEIYQAKELDLRWEFEFQKWRLGLRSIESMYGLETSEPQKGRIMEKVLCEIIGERGPL